MAFTECVRCPWFHIKFLIVEHSKCLVFGTEMCHFGTYLIWLYLTCQGVKLCWPLFLAWKNLFQRLLTGKNIFEQLKKSLNQKIDKSKNNDEVYVYLFYTHFNKEIYEINEAVVNFSFLQSNHWCVTTWFSFLDFLQLLVVVLTLSCACITLRMRLF